MAAEFQGRTKPVGSRVRREQIQGEKNPKEKDRIKRQKTSGFRCGRKLR